MKLTKYGAEQKKKWSKGHLKWSLEKNDDIKFWEGFVDEGTTKEIVLKMDSDVYNHLWWSYINPILRKQNLKGLTSNHANDVVCKIIDAFHNNQSEVFLEQEVEDSIHLK
tara:strand:+ start:531 stop:860 length:330 start_codon:yes stop_codon:yes gene_type:complete